MGGPKDTADAIKRSCTEMRNAYAALARDAKPAADAMDTAIGRITQWECSQRQPHLDPNAPPPAPTIVRWEYKPRWWEQLFCMVTPIREVPHEKQGEAKEKARKMFGDAATNQKEFDLDVDAAAQTPEKLGDIISSWVTIAGTWSENVDAKIPDDPAWLGSKGKTDGWKGDAASNYAKIFAAQNKAAATATSAMDDLAKNCAAYLDRIQKNLTQFAKITNDQNKFFSELIAGSIPSKLDMGIALKAIDDGVKIINQLKTDEGKEVDALCTTSNDNIAALLNLNSIDLKINGMGQGAPGWPKLLPMEPAEKGSGSRLGEPELRFQTQYFKDHAKWWGEMKKTMDPIATQVRGVIEIPLMFARFHQFSADQSKAINALRTRMDVDVVGSAAATAGSLSSALDDSIKRYLANEAESTAAAQQIYDSVQAQ